MRVQQGSPALVLQQAGLQDESDLNRQRGLVFVQVWLPFFTPQSAEHDHRCDSLCHDE